MAAFFVTGTDTGVGKTLVSAALLCAAAARGWRAIGIKPVAAGCELQAGRWVNDDALLLQQSATVALDYPAGQSGRACAPRWRRTWPPPAEGVTLEVSKLVDALPGYRAPAPRPAAGRGRRRLAGSAERS